MFATIGVLSFFVMVVFLVMAFIAKMKKTGKAKKRLFYAVVFFALYLVMLTINNSIYPAKATIKKTDSTKQHVMKETQNEKAKKETIKKDGKTDQDVKKEENQVKPNIESTPTKNQTNNQQNNPAVNQPKNGTVYGTLDKSGLKKENEQIFRDTTSNQNILYLVAGNVITQVEVNLDPNLQINLQMDKDFLTTHAFDYMADDASLIQTKDNTDFVYESKKLGEKYDVAFVSDGGDNVITRVIVSEHQE